MQSPPRKTVLIRNDDGTTDAYIPFSERLPAFLERYPVEQDYAVIIEQREASALLPSLFELYRAAIAAGHKPADVGLPELDKFPQVVFTAKLVRNGQLLRSASAKRDVVFYKDWEVGETAAFQRLLASLGFGSSEFDRDEAHDQRDQGLRTELRALPAESATNKVPSDIESPVAAAATDGPRPPTPQLRRQIRDLAAQLNVAVPTLETHAEALEIYQDLLRRANDRTASRVTQSATDAAA